MKKKAVFPAAEGVVAGVLGVTIAMAGGSALAAGDAVEAQSAPLTVLDIEDPRGFSEGARVLMCDEIGFLSFVWGIDEELRSPQFPGAEVQYADGLIAITDEVEINGISVRQSAFLSHLASGDWGYSGYRGTMPVADTCADITADLSESFVDLALAASWGMPQVRQRVDLFDALEDDLRTRLELAELEGRKARDEAEALRVDLAGLETEIETARMAVCEIATHTQGLLVEASAGGGAETPEAFVNALAEVGALTDCIDDAVMVSGSNAGPR